MSPEDYEVLSEYTPCKKSIVQFVLDKVSQVLRGQSEPRQLVNYHTYQTQVQRIARFNLEDLKKFYRDKLTGRHDLECNKFTFGPYELSQIMIAAISSRPPGHEKLDWCIQTFFTGSGQRVLLDENVFYTALKYGNVDHVKKVHGLYHKNTKFSSNLYDLNSSMIPVTQVDEQTYVQIFDFLQSLNCKCTSSLGIDCKNFLYVENIHREARRPAMHCVQKYNDAMHNRVLANAKCYTSDFAESVLAHTSELTTEHPLWIKFQSSITPNTWVYACKHGNTEFCQLLKSSGVMPLGLETLDASTNGRTNKECIEIMLGCMQTRDQDPMFAHVITDSTKILHSEIDELKATRVYNTCVNRIIGRLLHIGIYDPVLYFAQDYMNESTVIRILSQHAHMFTPELWSDTLIVLYERGLCDSAFNIQINDEAESEYIRRKLRPIIANNQSTGLPRDLLRYYVQWYL